ncbi:Asp-tRNA(Asn)/Glu-tRNA(Gln) amidotransferase subunit GatB [Dehalococcoidia bacterium]|nr:Asp-tRNA(Asn)/Glu-tRNA(Gln) amidotransferase subunit GatB [Dehalococcoidia bacterium]
MEYETVIGLEVHAQLLTNSKMFCACSADYQNAPPNTVVCEVCMAQPGVLPVVNRRAVELVIATGLSVGCTIAEDTKFDRKNYPYPDLMKGYQISQYDMPIASNGTLRIRTENGDKVVRINRVHLEEDVARLLHRSKNGQPYSLLDVNRAGVPLMETVSEPDMRTPDEARAYLISLRSILRYIGASRANMEEGSFRCDANVSVRKKGETRLGRKVEVKNMNSFRSVFNALEYEQNRQIKLVEGGKAIVQETRGWNEDKQITESQRSKEGESDYRYFPDPDLPPLKIGATLVDEIRCQLPELPEARNNRFVTDFGLSIYDARLLTSSKFFADYFELVVESNKFLGKDLKRRAKSAGNWMLGEMTRLLKETGQNIETVKIRPKYLSELIDLVDGGTLSTTMARNVFELMFETGNAPKDIAERDGLVQLGDVDSLQPVVNQAVLENPNTVEDYLGGKDTALRYLVGQIMKTTRGKANPSVVTKLLTEKLEQIRQDDG